jgi:hypothetical protein
MELGMALPSPADTDGRDRFGRFKRGVSGNPAGGKRTAKRLLTEKLDRMAEADAPRLYAKIVALAEAGDLDALKFLVSRAWPARKGRPVTLSIPVSEDGRRSPLALLSAVLDAVARGEMTAEEAESLSKTVEAHGKAIDSTAMARIEALAGEKPKPRPRLAA